MKRKREHIRTASRSVAFGIALASVAVGTATTPGSHHGRQVSFQTADKRATKQVREMLTFLRDQAGKTMVSGQTDYPDLEWVTKETGKTPLILNLDFMSYTTQMGKKVDSTQRAIEWSKKRHGIVSYQWHWVSPLGAKELGKGFYTGSTTFDLAAAMSDPKSDAYKAILSDIDDVAAEVKKMDRAGVPILFRPLHEAQGTWFWWGAKGAAPCVALYKLIYHRLTDFHRLHNLAWVWNVYPEHEKKGDPAEWYPGDEIVDVVATDYLQGKRDYDALVKLTNGKKIIGLAETMNAPDPAKSIADGAPWAYWITWARRDWNGNSPKDIKASMNNPLTVSLESRTKS